MTAFILAVVLNAPEPPETSKPVAATRDEVKAPLEGHKTARRGCRSRRARPTARSPR